MIHKLGAKTILGLVNLVEFGPIKQIIPLTVDLIKRLPLLNDFWDKP
jgi:hypothetical protein